MTNVPVTGRAPVGHLLTSADPTTGVLVWECAVCFALINDIEGHSGWHAHPKLSYPPAKIEPTQNT